MKGDLKNYDKIMSRIKWWFFIDLFFLVAFYSKFTNQYMYLQFDEITVMCFRMFFWGSLGAVVACSLFVKKDIQLNEEAYQVGGENDINYRLPHQYDVSLYSHRICTSGILGVVACLLVLGGFNYFDLPVDSLNRKQKLFITVFCFLVGMYQGPFVNYLDATLKRNLKLRKDSGADDIQ